MKAELNAIEQTLREDLKLPGLTPIIMGVIEKLLKENVRIIKEGEEFYYCHECKKWFSTDDLKLVVDRVGHNQIEPPDEWAKCSCDSKVINDEVKTFSSDDLINLLNSENIGVV